MQNTFNGVGVEIDLKDPKNFMRVRETLTRMGIAIDDRLYQSCHILHKRGEYAIVHFKELFILDGKIEQTEIDDEDYARRDKIAKLLERWNLLEIKNPKDLSSVEPTTEIKIIPIKEKSEWKLVSKYTIGKKKTQPERRDTVLENKG